MSETVPIPQLESQPQKLDFEIVADRLKQQEKEIAEVLNQYFLGNRDKIFRWMFDSHGSGVFDGLIPSAALVLHPEDVYAYVMKNMKGYVDLEEAKRPPEGPSYDVPPPKGA